MKFEYIIPIIVFVVWVLNQLLRNREVEEPVRPRPGTPEPNRGATNDIDRFLQEIDRLRRKGPEVRAESAERPVAQPVPRARPVAQPVPRARPVVRIKESRPTEPAAEVIATVPVLPSAPSLHSPSPRTPQVERRPSTVAGAAVSLLRSPQSLAAAIVLQEVLGPPKCRQR